MTVQLFDSSLPKFFWKSKNRKVVRGTESLFDRINTYDEWDELRFGFWYRLNEELCNTEITIESAITEYRTLVEAGRPLVSNAFPTVASFAGTMMRHIDQAWNQLVRSKCLKEKRGLYS